ncbi:GIY-YIG nuclease family protein [Wenzhouxiangella sp. AB-CW3]|uniref:GIY-YIG nuclease family protein n=1 Tax=Wenzhouxiangella sp. AB-CW3 TaxID=2771012 RepID=UPI00168AB095|nr:GIY-YIG nuclease family protein [Wenzhouxiangella sp. AB-CW3]QOC23822.1 GIY-YIG nuclease family protein [Wenzhouxiangella sp. AB-CW3]
MERDCFVYIVTNRLRGTLYVGVTNNLIRRVWEHRLGLVPGFTQKYRLRRLVYFEHFSDFGHAIEREKRLKRWRRDWKLTLIEKDNPQWQDLYPRIAHSEGVDTHVPY